MKKLFLAATLVFAGFTAVQAKDVKTSVNQSVIRTDSVTKTSVKLEELPAPVQQSLKNEAYKDWTPTAAFLVKDAAANKEWYQVDVKNNKKETETGSVNFDKEGKPVQ